MSAPNTNISLLQSPKSGVSHGDKTETSIAVDGSVRVRPSVATADTSIDVRDLDSELHDSVSRIRLRSSKPSVTSQS